MPEPVPVIAIDGTAGSGKGTLARNLALSLGWHFLDSGALYRALGLAALEAKVDPTDSEACGRVARAARLEVQADPEAFRVILNGTDVSTRIRELGVGHCASQISAHPTVRDTLLERQRATRLPPGLVADGRDMGTVVFPDASLKVYLTASAETRAQRRLRQLEEMGISAKIDTLIEEIKERDLRDTQRGASPLYQAPDAILIDATECSIEEVEAKARACLPGTLTPLTPKGTLT